MKDSLGLQLVALFQRDSSRLSMNTPSEGLIELIAACHDDPGMIAQLFAYRANIGMVNSLVSSIESYFRRLLEEFEKISNIRALGPTITNYVKSIDARISAHQEHISAIQSNEKGSAFNDSLDTAEKLNTLKELLLKLEAAIGFTQPVSEHIHTLIAEIVSCAATCSNPTTSGM